MIMKYAWMLPKNMIVGGAIKESAGELGVNEGTWLESMWAWSLSEGMWDSRDHLDSYLCEFLWRKSYHNCGLFEQTTHFRFAYKHILYDFGTHTERSIVPVVGNTDSWQRYTLQTYYLRLNATFLVRPSRITALMNNISLKVIIFLYHKNRTLTFFKIMKSRHQIKLACMCIKSM